MASLEDSNSTSVRDNSLVELIGADGTAIGNVSDSTKVNVTNASGASAVNIQDGGNSITVDGTISAIPLDGTKTSYSAGTSGLVLVASATDVFTITGSATKTIRVTRVEFTATTTSGSGTAANLSLIKRSTANSGGTSSTANIAPHDSTNAAATAVVRSYTANPTLGTTTGIIRNKRYAVPTANTVILVEWNFGDRPSQAIALRGTSEILAVNLGGNTITGGTASINVEWTEED